jgi:hypothetical protein
MTALPLDLPEEKLRRLEVVAVLVVPASSGSSRRCPASCWQKRTRRPDSSCALSVAPGEKCEVWRCWGKFQTADNVRSKHLVSLTADFVRSCEVSRLTLGIAE